MDRRSDSPSAADSKAMRPSSRAHRSRSVESNQRNSHEGSPLLSAPEHPTDRTRDRSGSRAKTRLPPLDINRQDAAEYEQNGLWAGSDTSQDTKSSWYMFKLTVCIMGLQICWSVEMAYGSPFLLSLGISKSVLGLVWIAGPLSGILVQPYIGSKSDACRSRFGKRRPFIVLGGLTTVLSLFALAWSREIVAGVFSILGIGSDTSFVDSIVIIWAVLMIYVLDFAINVFQAVIRAFIVDCSPVHQQNAANAWASRLSGVSNIVGFMFGFVDLPELMPWLANTQFKALCILSTVVLVSTSAFSITSVRERDPRRDPPPPEDQGIFKFFFNLYSSMRRLPLQIKRVCQTQFLAWIGWFPFLFYTTTFLGNLYVDPFLREEPNMPKERLDKLYEEGTRVATLALMGYAVITLIFTIILPQMIQQPKKPPRRAPFTPMTPGNDPSVVSPGFPSNSSSSHVGAHASKRPSGPSRTWRRVMEVMPNTRVPGLTLRRLFVISHVAFAAFTWIASFTSSVGFASVMIGLVGIPWAVTSWAPFTLIAAEISKRDAIRRGQIAAPDTDEGRALARGDDTHAADQAGVVLGIHNLCLSAPQMLATLMGSLIFKMLQKERGQAGDTSVAWVFRLGGLCALAAAYMATKIQEEDFTPVDDGGTKAIRGHERSIEGR